MTKYELAVNEWIAAKVGCDPSQIANADFYHHDGFAYSEYTWEPGSSGLQYTRNGKVEHMALLYTITPGQFIEEVAAILAKL